MRRRFTVSAAVIGLALAASLALARPASAQEGRSWGFGVGIGTTAGAPAAGVSGTSPVFYVPIALGDDDDVFLEPSFGLLRLSSDGGSATVLRLGTGLLFMNEIGSAGRAYVGPRAGIVHTSTDSGVGDSDDTDVYIAGVTGGEFFLVQSFTLGGEVGIGYAFSDPSVLSTLAAFRVRWYLR